MTLDGSASFQPDKLAALSSKTLVDELLDLKTFLKSFLEVKTGEESCVEGFGVFRVVGVVACFDLDLRVLLLFFPAESFLVVTGRCSGVEGMIIGVEGCSS